MKKILFLSIAVAFFSCNSDSDKSTSDSTVTKTSNVVAKPADTTAKKTDEASTSNLKWVYSTDTDKMTSKLNYYAAIQAKETLNFPAPYDGGSTASLTIRNDAGKNNVILKVSKGQFNSTVTDGESIKIRFDNDQPVTFLGSEASDGSTEVLFINSENKLIKKLKTAQKILIEAEFYEAGLKTMEFDVKDFKWDH